MLATSNSPHEKGFHRVVMDWVLVIDRQGNRRPQMRWRTS